MQNINKSALDTWKSIRFGPPPNNRSSDRAIVESERLIENLHKNHPG